MALSSLDSRIYHPTQFVLVVLGVNVANVIGMCGVNRKKVSPQSPDEPQHEMEQTVIGYCYFITAIAMFLVLSALYVIIIAVIRQSFEFTSTTFQGMARNNVGVVISRVNIVCSSKVMLEGTLVMVIIIVLAVV
jgi:hypothetical protein